MSWIAVGVGAATLINGQMQANSAKDSADAARKAALGQYSGLSIPDIESQKVALQDQSVAGTLTPEMQQAIALGDTSLSNISTDPRLQASQMAALSQYGQLANTGMTAADQASYTQAQNSAAAQGQAKQAQILQNMQQRGIGGSGAELIAKLNANQNSTQNLQAAQMQQAQAQQQARMAALQQQAGLSTSVRGQNYSEAANLASARDAIAKYNAANSQNTSNSNVAAKNQAQSANLANAQAVANANTAKANQQEQYNKGLIQTNYQNQVQKAGGTAAQLNSTAAADQAQAANTAAAWAQGGQALAGAYTAANKK